MPLDFEAVARAAEAAADAARAETLPRFRRVGFETKADGSPVTEADKAAERVIRDSLAKAFPDFAVLGEEFGAEGRPDAPRFVIDPIDGTIAFSRGLPLYTPLIGLLDEGRPVFGLIDCPVLDERYVGWLGGGCRRNGEPTRVSGDDDVAKAIVAHGDPYCFQRVGAGAVWERLARECGLLRGYTDAFGHAQVLGGGVAAFFEVWCNVWDMTPTEILVKEAGGSYAPLAHPDGKIGAIFGSPRLVDTLAGWWDEAGLTRPHAR